MKRHVRILEPLEAIAIAKEKAHIKYVRDEKRLIEKPAQVKFLPADTTTDGAIQ